MEERKKKSDKASKYVYMDRFVKSRDQQTEELKKMGRRIDRLYIFSLTMFVVWLGFGIIIFSK